MKITVGLKKNHRVWPYSITLPETSNGVLVYPDIYIISVTRLLKADPSFFIRWMLNICFCYNNVWLCYENHWKCSWRNSVLLLHISSIIHETLTKFPFMQKKYTSNRNLWFSQRQNWWNDQNCSKLQKFGCHEPGLNTKRKKCLILFSQMTSTILIWIFTISH